MTQAALVNKVRQSDTQPTGSDCQACPTVGLPILPVRYAAVPRALPGFDLPGSCSNPSLPDADSNLLEIKSNKYALRTIRPGFLYFYYKSPESGAWTWQCYMVSPGGSLREVPIASKGLVVPSDPACNSSAHNINASIISLKKPEKIDKAYVAYSEHFWSAEARGQVEKNYQKRMTEFSPAAWIKSQSQDHAFKPGEVATRVVEYSAASLEKNLKGSYFDYRSRSGQAAGLIERMEKINPGKGMILAVPDPIGCVSDLNSFRMHVKDEYQKYVHSDEVTWKLSCSTQIDGLRSYAAQQTKESLKNARTQYVPTGGMGHTGMHEISKQDQIEFQTKQAFERFERYYDEAARQKFHADFEKKCKEFQARILGLDQDYVIWKESTSLALAVDDYDKGKNFCSITAAEVQNRILAGGIISDASLASWERLLKRDATDLKNYAIGGILLNQKEWRSKFKDASEKDLIDHIWKDNNGKVFDVSRNFSESDTLSQQNIAANSGINKAAEWSADLLVTINGSLMKVIQKVTEKTGAGADSAALKIVTELEALQIKLGLAYSFLHSATNVILLQIDLTVDEWHRIMSSQLRKSMENVSRQATKTFAAMAIAADLRIPAGSAAGQTVLSFTFWMHGTVQQINRELGELSVSVGDSAANTGRAIAKGSVATAGAAAKAGTAAGGVVVGSAAAGMRTVRVIGHTFPKGAAIIASIPTHLSATRAGALAARVTRNSLTALAAADVKLAAPALAFQLYALRKSLNDFENSVGSKHADSVWAVGSSAMGLTAASFELAGKAWKAIKPGASIWGGRITAAAVIKHAGFIGAGASAVDCVQNILRSNTLAKQGNSTAAYIHFFAAAVAGFAAYAGVMMALGSTAFFGPVGVLIACIGLGLLLAYAAFIMEDTAVGIWLDRSKFGYANRTEGPFASRQHELDGLELVSRSVSVEVEWLDTAITSLGFSQDEISISVKRNENASDALILGLLIQGKSGARRVFVRQQGFAAGTNRNEALWPQNFVKTPIAKSTVGKDFEARLRHDEGGVKNIKEDEQKITAWEEVVELDAGRFDRATVWLRYFPDKKDELTYFDDNLLVADDSRALGEENRRKKIR